MPRSARPAFSDAMFMRGQVARLVVTLGLLPIVFAGCSSISKLFPDKHKQYQYTTEIDALEIPPDLTSTTIDGAHGGRHDAWESPAQSSEASTENPSDGREATPAPGAEMSSESSRAYRKGSGHPAPVLAESAEDSVPLIEVQAPIEITWAEVNKALGRLKLEITDQNKASGLYVVHYLKDQQDYEDRGFFGDVAQMFGQGPSRSHEYRIKLEQRDEVTSIFVLDSEGKVLRDGEGLELLKQLNATLQSTSLGGHTNK